MEIINFIRSYPAWAQLLFVLCVAIQLCLAFFSPRAPTTKSESRSSAPSAGPIQQAATGQGNIQIGIAEIVQFAVGTEPNNRVQSEILASFIIEAQELRKRLEENPLPVKEHNDWVERINDQLKTGLGQAYVVRFNDFSGMTLYGDGSDRSKMSNSIEARSKRLHEFISELAR